MIECRRCNNQNDSTQTQCKRCGVCLQEHSWGETTQSCGGSQGCTKCHTRRYVSQENES